MYKKYLKKKCNKMKKKRNEICFIMKQCSKCFSTYTSIYNFLLKEQKRKKMLSHNYLYKSINQIIFHLMLFLYRLLAEEKKKKKAYISVL